MATDVEESDIDDRERPASPKRQRTRLVPVNETPWNTEKSSSAKEELVQDTGNIEYEDAERQANEKLKMWQAFQVVKGFIDNLLNICSEIYTIMTADTLEESSFELFGDIMQDSAVMMAIRSHGLVQSNELVPQSNAFYSDKAPGYWTNNDHTDIHCSCPSNQVKDVGNFGNSIATASTNSLGLNNSANMEEHDASDWDLDKMDESNQQQNFLERAVAEAIKKKGLTVLLESTMVE